MLNLVLNVVNCECSLAKIIVANLFGETMRHVLVRVAVQQWHSRLKLTSLFFPRICAGSYYVLNLVLAVMIERSYS